ncbi:MAG: hypothetical protein WBC63_09690, partial [Candidatus Bipolaricaulia bacterium]
MKRLGVLAVLGLTIVGLGAATWGLSLCDYRSPITALTNARMSFAYRYFNDAGTPEIDVNSGRIGLDYDQLFDSPNYGFTLGGSVELTLDAFVPTGWLGQGGATFRFYPFKEALFFGYGGLEASLATGQPRPGVDVRIGLGLGRFSDVTPLAKAVLIEDELLATDAIFEVLAGDVLLGIAGVIGREAEYDTVKEMVADIESLIEAVARVELDARALLTIEEFILMSEPNRKCGWAIQGGIGYELIDPFGGDQNIVIVASADAAFATSPGDQFLLHASFSGPFDFMEENTLTATLSYEYELGEESKLYADYAFQRVKPLGLPANVSHAASMSVGFDINGIDIGLQVSLTREPGDPGWSIDVSISAAIDLI